MYPRLQRYEHSMESAEHCSARLPGLPRASSFSSPSSKTLFTVRTLHCLVSCERFGPSSTASSAPAFTILIPFAESVLQIRRPSGSKQAASSPSKPRLHDNVFVQIPSPSRYQILDDNESTTPSTKAQRPAETVSTSFVCQLHPTATSPHTQTPDGAPSSNSPALSRQRQNRTRHFHGNGSASTILTALVTDIIPDGQRSKPQ